ncbi:MAG TPA: carboxypeptidase-like regulatory domain-containing protein [Lacipirellulaceae bacterium]|nr:carboxypeptidase-like regulatory domain-containing protein [Lacipirellulaceae bacterium]
MSTNARCRSVGLWRSLPAIGVLLVGCGGGQEAEVRGVVTLDGAPLSGGSVTFVPVERGAGASANINAEGSYAALTGSSQGLQPGEYVVTVRASAPPSPDPKGGPPIPGKLLTPKKYGSTQTSDLRATISAGRNTLNLELRSDGA